MSDIWLTLLEIEVLRLSRKFKTQREIARAMNKDPAAISRMFKAAKYKISKSKSTLEFVKKEGLMPHSV